MKAITHNNHSNDPWSDGVRTVSLNPESRVARTLKVIGKVLGVLFKIVFCLFIGLAKLWAMTPEPDHQEELAKEQDEDFFGSPFLGEYIDGERKIF